jgi:hypothetical protein
MKSLFSARNILEQIEKKEKCFLVNQDAATTEEIERIIEDENWDELKQEQQYRGDNEEINDALRKKDCQNGKIRIELENLLAQSERRLKECEMRLLHNEEARVGLEALAIQCKEQSSGQLARSEEARGFLQTDDMEAVRDENNNYDDDKKLELLIEDMRTLKDNRASKAIAPSRKRFNTLIIFFKRIIRKLIRWYVEPMAERQTLFNNAVFSWAHEILLLNAFLIKRIDELNCSSDQNKQEIKKNKDIFTQSLRRMRKETIKSLEIFINELGGE